MSFCCKNANFPNVFKRGYPIDLDATNANVQRGLAIRHLKLFMHLPKSYDIFQNVESPFSSVKPYAHNGIP